MKSNFATPDSIGADRQLAVRSSAARFLIIPALFLTLTGCGGSWSSLSSSPPGTSIPKAAPLVAKSEASEVSIRYLEEKVRRDPEDFIAYNQLASNYLQRLRETGNVTYLELAEKAATKSMAVLPPEHNLSGLIERALVEYASHSFNEARDDAQLSLKFKPDAGYSYQILGDSLIELGDYAGADAAFKEMTKIAAHQGLIDSITETRIGHLALLNGQIGPAKQHFTKALTMALEQSPPPAETVAWCRWQLGEIAFAAGEYETAEQYYRDSLTTFPNYYRAVGALGKVRAARNEINDAISYYESAVRILPDPTFVAALGDLYKISGREKDAEAQYKLVEQIDRLSKLNGVLYNRQLALFYADHDLNPEVGYDSAAKEYAQRRDIYGADAVAWTALKSNRLAEAQTAIKEALRIGTQDARLFYHAGMIARAAGDTAAARQYLDRALKLSPQFDPIQAKIARQVREELK